MITGGVERDAASVSVVVPCYRCADVLGRAVDSVLRQALLPEELILVDDASPDEGKTRECIEDLRQKYGESSGVKIVPVFLDVNLGPGGARNAGRDSASGKYVAFLDSDDAWHRDKLAVQVPWMELHPGIALCGHQLEYGKLSPGSFVVSDAVSTSVSLTQMLFKNRFLTSTVMVRRNAGYRFQAGVRYSEDYALWMSMIADGCGAAVLDLPLAKAYRPPFSIGGASADLWKMELAELLMFRGMVARGKTGPVGGLLGAAVSFVKFLRRVLLSRIR